MLDNNVPTSPNGFKYTLVEYINLPLRVNMFYKQIYYFSIYNSFNVKLFILFNLILLICLLTIFSNTSSAA